MLSGLSESGKAMYTLSRVTPVLRIFDEAKARVPIWKKEHYVSGASEWINCATRGEHATPQNR